MGKEIKAELVALDGIGREDRDYRRLWSAYEKLQNEIIDRVSNGIRIGSKSSSMSFVKLIEYRMAPECFFKSSSSFALPIFNR
jgi:hypothetical protein